MAYRGRDHYPVGVAFDMVDEHTDGGGRPGCVGSGHHVVGCGDGAGVTYDRHHAHPIRATYEEICKPANCTNSAEKRREALILQCNDNRTAAIVTSHGQLQIHERTTGEVEVHFASKVI